MTMPADPCVHLGSKVSHRVHNDKSHRIVTLALTEVALAAMHPAQPRHRTIGVAGSAGGFDRARDAGRGETLVDCLGDLVEFLPPAAIDKREQTGHGRARFEIDDGDPTPCPRRRRRPALQ